MTDLIDYLRDKLEHAEAGCTCPTAEWLSTLPPDAEVIADCVEHGGTRQYAGGYIWHVKTRWWRR